MVGPARLLAVPRVAPGEREAQSASWCALGFLQVYRRMASPTAWAGLGSLGFRAAALCEALAFCTWPRTENCPSSPTLLLVFARGVCPLLGSFIGRPLPRVGRDVVSLASHPQDLYGLRTVLRLDWHLAASEYAMHDREEPGMTRLIRHVIVAYRIVSYRIVSYRIVS